MESLVFIWLVCGLFGAAILSPHNRAGLGCLAGGLLGPLGVIAAFIERGNLQRAEDAHRHAEQLAATHHLAATGVQPARRAEVEARDERECPHCAERILTRAKLCKHCGREVAPVMPWDASA
jgi:hypothetical protein